MSKNIGDRFFRAFLPGLVLTQMAEHEKRATLVFCFDNSGRTCFTSLNDERLRLTASVGWLSLERNSDVYPHAQIPQVKERITWQCSWHAR